MTEATAAPPLNLDQLHAELLRLRERIEDLEDLRDAREAIARNGGKPGVPWEEVKAELGLDR